jgi:hypothetical protein
VGKGQRPPESPIGDMILTPIEKALLARIYVPVKSYEMIRWSLLCKPKGFIQLVGNKIAEVRRMYFYLRFDSTKFPAVPL